MLGGHGCLIHRLGGLLCLTVSVGVSCLGFWADSNALLEDLQYIFVFWNYKDISINECQPVFMWYSEIDFFFMELGSLSLKNKANNFRDDIDG